jgi:phytol kinase
MSRSSVSDNRLLNARAKSLAGPVAPRTRTLPERIPGVRYLIDTLGVTEFRRRLLHMLPGLLPGLLWFIPHTDPWGVPLVGASILLAVTVSIVAIAREREFLREDETLWYQAVIGYIAPVMLLLLFLRGRSELGLMTLGIVAFGDGSATLGGTLLGGRRLLWNRKKSWSGLFCFVCFGSIAATFNYWIEARPVVPVGTIACIAVVSTMAAAIVESLPIRSQDNLRVGSTAAAACVLMQGLLLGW